MNAMFDDSRRITLKRFFENHIRWLLAVFIMACGVLIYSNTFDGSFHFDDDHYIVDNGFIRNLWHPEPLFLFWPTRFISFLSFSLNYYFNRLDVFGYHVVNICIHIAASLLAWWFFSLILKTPSMKDRREDASFKAAAFFSALIFLTHPLQTESVAYIYQRMTSLAALFYLLTLCFYLKARLLAAQRLRRRFLFIAAWVFCFLGMLTKENVATLPVMLLVCEFYFFKTGRNMEWKYSLPFLPLAFIVPVSLIIFKPATFGDVQRIYDAPGAQWFYVLTQPRVVITYLRLLLFPANQNLDYDYPMIKNPLDLSLMLSVVLLSLLLVFSRRLFSNRKLLSFAIVWFFVTLLPESSVVPLNDLIFEHRLYLPMVGFAGFVCFGLLSLFPREKAKTAFVILLALAVCYGVLTFQRNKVWRDELSLWNDVIVKSPRKPGPRVNRAIVLNNRRLYEEALLDINRAISERPDFGEAYVVRGGILYNQRRHEEALRDYNQAFLLRPGDSLVLFNRGTLFLRMGEYEKAANDYVEVIKLDPSYIQAYYNLASLYAGLGRNETAKRILLKTYEIDPLNVRVCNVLAMLYSQERDYANALFYAERAISLDAGSSQGYLTAGIAYGALGDIEKTISYLEKAVELKPDMALGYYNLAVVYYHLGDCRQAVKYCDKALAFNRQINPDFLKIIDECRIRGEQRSL